jgi:molybdopterin molybdotransferase
MIGHGLTSVDAYRAAVIAAVRPLPPRRTPLDEADGTVLAQDVTARVPLPLFDNSAMDGYAVMARDVAMATPATPVTLPVEAEVTAGDTRPRRLDPSTSMKITTGALLPAGADAVVRAEWTDGGSQKVVITRPAVPGDSVRLSGREARPGDVLLTAGTPLGPAQIALLVAAGRHAVLARPRPKLAILSAGNELVAPGGAVLPGQVWESNSLMIAAAARRAGAVPRRLSPAGDDPGQVLAAVRDAIGGSDLVVASGGISAGGEHDVFKATLQGLDTVRFCRVAMRPGMPQGFGTVGVPPTPILLLPGNPVSAFVSFCLFAGPALRTLQGHRRRLPRTSSAVLAAPVTSPAGKASFVAAVYDAATGEVTPVGHSSHELTALALANALIAVPAPVTAMAAGDMAEILELPA